MILAPYHQIFPKCVNGIRQVFNSASDFRCKYKWFYKYIRKLKNAGLYEETIIIYNSDHVYGSQIKDSSIPESDPLSLDHTYS